MKKPLINRRHLELPQADDRRSPLSLQVVFSLAYANIQPVSRNERANTIISLPFLQANCVEASGGVAANGQRYDFVPD